jgi:hypothetical protein
MFQSKEADRLRKGIDYLQDFLDSGTREAVCVRERDSVCERERANDRVCVRERERESEGEREQERERERESAHLQGY